MIKGLICLGLITFLAGCPAAYVNGVPNETSPYYQLAAGSELILEKKVHVPAGGNQLYFQNGRTMDWHEVNIYLPHCALKVASKQAAARPIHPDRFSVGRTYAERFFQRVHAPEKLPALETAALGTFTVTDLDRDTGFDYEVVAIVMELHSERQPEVSALICADWGLAQDTLHITVQKIRRALGPFFTIKTRQPTQSAVYFCAQARQR
jgi:hypothetical protein